MEAHEIILPETKPALEWIDGRIVQKVSPQRAHALAQGMFFAALQSWASKHRCGVAGTEWEFRLAPPGEIRRQLVPDVAYVSYASIPREKLKKIGIPHVAPDAVVEILSPRDRLRDLQKKIRVYQACGTSVIFLVNTKQQTVTARSADETSLFGSRDTVAHPSLPGFAMQASTLFELP